MISPRGAAVLVVSILLGLAAGLPAQAPSASEKVLIHASKPYASVVARVRALGGTVTNQYEHIDAISADIPVSGIIGLQNLVGVAAVSKDVEIAIPRSVDPFRGRHIAITGVESDMLADSVAALSADDLTTLASISPDGYRLNASIANVAPLHAAGVLGQGVVVAVIDTGIRPGFPHISLDGSVIGCENFVPDALGCSNSANDGHGTFVAGMISANVSFIFSAASSIRNAVLAECPACFANPPTNTVIPMIGTAPRSSIYALRVFGPSGSGPASRILAAMDRAIALREAYNSNPATGVHITVANLSLGGATIYAGRDFFDQMTDAMLGHDILPVIAAGNAGPASMTVGSPGTAISALTVGAASLSHNERILERLQLGPVVGPQYRPFLGHQMAFFSSRGPDADGRLDPDVVANGFASFGQGYGSTSSISLASGTSFATPTTAGVAALLRQLYPAATGRQIRNAIIASANPSVLSDGSTVIDQGAGYVDGLAAAGLLAAGLVPDELPAPTHFTKNVDVNIQQNTFLHAQAGSVFESAENLRPGERHEVVYKVGPNVNRVVVTLSNVTPALPSSEQNQLFGDDILLSVHSAKTSAIGEGDYKVFEFSKGGMFEIQDPEPGLMRITISGDWTNAGTISADVGISSSVEATPQTSTQNKIADQEILTYPVTMPSGVKQAEFRLGWREDWGQYPASDLDLILVAPNGSVNLAGASLSDPEVAVVANPTPGTWTVLVIGFQVNTATDKFELRISLDGNVLKIN